MKSGSISDVYACMPCFILEKMLFALTSLGSVTASEVFSGKCI